jgi:hypothetical protein
MGAWGIGIFENDDAMDWAVPFGHAPSAQSLRQAFEAVSCGTLGRNQACGRMDGSHR